MIHGKRTPSDCILLGVVIEVCALAIYLWKGRVNYPLIVLGMFSCAWAGVEAKWLSHRKLGRPAIQSVVERRMRLRTLLIAITAVAVVLGLAAYALR